MIYGLVPPGGGGLVAIPPGNKDQVSGNCAARFLWHVGRGSLSVALALELIPETEGRRCTAPQREGEEVSRSAAVVLLRGACSCPMAKLRYGHVALLGEARGFAPLTPDPRLSFPNPPGRAGTGGSRGAGGWRVVIL